MIITTISIIDITTIIAIIITMEELLPVLLLGIRLLGLGVCGSGFRVVL